MQQVSLPASQKRTGQLMNKYGELNCFLTKFNPDIQCEICTKVDDCYFGDYPTFSDIRLAYGSESAVMWLIPQLYNLSEYCGCKEKLQGRQLEECASIIASEFHYLKVSEVMLFLYRFKTGQYGRFYGSVDPLVITTSLREFLKERAFAYDRHDREERHRRRDEERKNAVSWEEYCRTHDVEDKTHPLMRRPPEVKQEAKEDAVVRLLHSFLDNPKKDKAAKEEFCRLFEEKYGCTPKEYIKRHSKT